MAARFPDSVHEGFVGTEAGDFPGRFPDALKKRAESDGGGSAAVAGGVENRLVVLEEGHLGLENGRFPRCRRGFPNVGSEQ